LEKAKELIEGKSLFKRDSFFALIEIIQICDKAIPKVTNKIKLPVFFD